MNSNESSEPLDRRAMLRRTGVVVGAGVWATPIVQTIASPAFAAGSAPPTPGFRACLSGGGTLVRSQEFDPLAAITFTLVQPLCCGETVGTVQVTTTEDSGATRDYVFDDVRDSVFCHPQLTCTDCPSGIEGEIWGTGPEGDPARLFFSFENNDPAADQRGEPMDFASMSVEEGPEDDPTLRGIGGAPASGAVMHCDSC